MSKHHIGDTQVTSLSAKVATGMDDKCSLLLLLYDAKPNNALFLKDTPQNFRRLALFDPSMGNLMIPGLS